MYICLQVGLRLICARPWLSDSLQADGLDSAAQQRGSFAHATRRSSNLSQVPSPSSPTSPTSSSSAQDSTQGGPTSPSPSPSPQGRMEVAPPSPQPSGRSEASGCAPSAATEAHGREHGQAQGVSQGSACSARQWPDREALPWQDHHQPAHPQACRAQASQRQACPSSSPTTAAQDHAQQHN